MVETEQDVGWQIATPDAENYQRYLVPALLADLAATLVDAAAIQPGESVLDVACGTGIVARTAAAAAGPSGAVTAIDINPAMLAVARRVEQNDASKIDWREGDAVAIPLPDATIDVALCQAALMFFPDRPAAVAEMRRVLAPAGRVLIQVFRDIDHSPAYAALAGCFARHLGPEVGEMIHSLFGLGAREQITALLRDAGFRATRQTIAVHAARYPSAAEAARRELAVSPAAAALAGLDDNARAALAADAETALAPWADDDGVALPIESWIVRAAH
jgi:ubiquinone/menaquinone biosynthesis C-methylase UbiE